MEGKTLLQLHEEANEQFFIAAEALRVLSVKLAEVAKAEGPTKVGMTCLFAASRTADQAAIMLESAEQQRELLSNM